MISEAKRNATVTMTRDGAVMRLGKEDFKKLLNEPMLDWVDAEQAREDRQGRAVNGWTFACQANSRTITSMARSIFRCTSSD